MDDSCGMMDEEDDIISVHLFPTLISIQFVFIIKPEKIKCFEFLYKLAKLRSNEILCENSIDIQFKRYGINNV